MRQLLQVSSAWGLLRLVCKHCSENPPLRYTHFMQLPRYFLGVAVAAFALPAHAIQIRPDRDDAEYLELAGRYPSAVALPEGGAALIAPRWVLTSAQRAKALRDAKPVPRLRFGEDEHEIQSFFVGDVGLLLLRRGVRGIEPSRLYREG